MAIDRDQGVRRVSVKEILDEPLVIPAYQRPYSWEPSVAVQLLDDLRAAFRGHADQLESKATGAGSYVLGAVILHRDEQAQTTNVVDGQQRLLTLTILLDILDAPDAHTNTAKGQMVEEVPTAPVVLARQRLARRVMMMADDPGRLADFIRDNCELIRVETDDVDEAFRVFDSQNYRGKALLPHDLLKAFHLREMHGESESMKIALVETWESAADADLDRLFSTYLWRIRQWSRGLSAPPFAARHVGVLKGITTRSTQTPAAKYHLAAQAAVPLLAAWEVSSEEAVRSGSRSRFQLDAPVHAGRSFFEMVSFMMGELKRLRLEGYSDQGWDAYASTDNDFREIPSKSRYRFVSEMYLASLLYYTNKFGDSELPEAKRSLMRWAYSLRTQLLRVQMVSVDNHAKDLVDGNSAFVVLRNADTPSDLNRLSAGGIGREQNPGHMKELTAFLNGLGG
ncbi:DUF262 domain-containing protein [Rhodococcoides fascians]|uniref:DUF262 domain-containing protein n=1 Tax=Rhodococcoides fascians TaxID=1828 RepID=UPI001DE4904F|nr:DUF262 domain-containing protein [Rhodococcus fascians]CAH0230517.1 hypothetical protein SRABI91_02626 [Rhodococcus fascians]